MGRLSSLGRVRGARSCDKGRKVCEANARAQPVTIIIDLINEFSLNNLLKRGIKIW